MILPGISCAADLLLAFIIGAVTAFISADAYSHGNYPMMAVMAALCAGCSLWFAFALYVAHEEWKNHRRF